MKNKEVEDAHRRGIKAIEDAERTAKETIEKRVIEEERKTRQIIDTIYMGAPIGTA